MPSDFSPISEAALRLACNIARRYDSKVHIAHVIVPEIYSPGPIEGMPLPLEEPRRRVQAELERMRNSACLRDVRHHQIVRYGAIWDQIQAVLREEKVDMIVAGTHGAGGLQKVLLGSIAEEIFRKAECPVITVGPQVTAENLDIGFTHVLFATDLSPQSLHAAPYAFSLAQEYHARLTMLTVIEDLKDSSPQGRILARMSHENDLKRRLPRPADFLRALSYEVLFGAAPEVIVQAAASLGANLIVLGVRKAEGLASHLPWTTASQVVRSSKCPVLTVRQ